MLLESSIVCCSAMSKTLIFDNGCSTIKAGFTTDEKPRYDFAFLFDIVSS